MDDCATGVTSRAHCLVIEIVVDLRRVDLRHAMIAFVLVLAHRNDHAIIVMITIDMAAVIVMMTVVAMMIAPVTVRIAIVTIAIVTIAIVRMIVVAMMIALVIVAMMIALVIAAMIIVTMVIVRILTDTMVIASALVPGHPSEIVAIEHVTIVAIVNPASNGPRARLSANLKTAEHILD